MNIIPMNTYPKFAHYRSYSYSVASLTTIDVSSDLPGDPTYLIGTFINSGYHIIISSEANDTTAGAGIASSTPQYLFFTPILVRTVKLKNTGSGTYEFYLIYAWN